MASEFNPNPSNTESNPSSCLNRDTIGILPPSRVGIGSFPHTSAKASLAALYADDVVDVTAGSPPWWAVTFTFTDLGAIDLMCFVKSSVISLLLWFGTRRIEIFAVAFDGKTVFAPSPV